MLPENPQNESPDNGIGVGQTVPDEEVAAFIPMKSSFKYKDVDDAIRYSYHVKQTHNSTICDILAVYLKGQKILYTEAKTYCETKLSTLMIPSIIFSSLCTIIGPLLKDTSYGITVVSGLSGMTALLLAIVTHLKLDAKSEAHRASAYKFDKLQSYVEFNSGKVLFIDRFADDMEKIILETEKCVSEIKETNPFVLPEQIRYDFNLLYGTNVFAEIKRIQNFEMQIVNELKDVYNEISDIETVLLAKPTITATEANLTRYKDLNTRKKELITSVLQIRDDYLSIDRQFEKEIQRYKNNWCNRFSLFGWFST